jgi:uncharacterized protein (DUF1015 family)
MLEIMPFKGIVYQGEKVGGLDKVVTPPYDVIDSRAQQEFYDLSPYNSIRLILGKEFLTDDDKENKYTRAAEAFQEWLSEGILTRDEEPSIYLYEEEFNDTKGIRRRRRGFIAQLKLEELGKGNVFPHEETMSKPKEDRLRLTRACNANFSQVFGLYSASSLQVGQILSQISQGGPRMEVTDGDGVIHRVWSTSSEDIISQLQEALKDSKIYIADGHHRYETALNYRNEERARTGDRSGKAPFDYVMMMFVAIDDPGLVVFPFHRVLKGLDEGFVSGIPGALSSIFSVKDYKVPSGQGREGCARLLSEMESANQYAFGMYSGHENFRLFTLNADDEAIDKLVPGDMSLDKKRLDVTILHSVIFELLGLNADNRKADDIEFVRDENKVLEMVDSGEYQLAFFLNPTEVDSVRRIAENGEKMPQKSTYFYPKLLTGLVFRSIT